MMPSDSASAKPRIAAVSVWEEGKVSHVIVPDYQLSLAIGKAGQNARLAAKLTNWKIDIKSESQASEEGFEDFYEDDDEFDLDAEMMADTAETAADDAETEDRHEDA